MNMILPPAHPGCSAVIKAAEALGISEFDFFRLAYRRWSGLEASDDAMDKVFVAYMFHQRVPPWARHLSREVLRLLESGSLDPVAFGVSGFKRRQPLPRFSRFSWRLVASAILLVFLMSLDTTYPKNPALPIGCPGATGSMFFDRLASVFKSRSERECRPFVQPGQSDASRARSR